MEAKTESQNAATTSWSPWQDQRIWRSSGCEAKNDHILAFSEVLETMLTSWNSFNVNFAILFTPCCTWLIIPKAHTTPSNSNVHVSPVGSKVIEMCTRHKIRTFSIGTIWLVIFARDLFSRFSQVKTHLQKLKQLLSSMCKANQPSFNPWPAWNYLYSCQQNRVGECAFDGHPWSYPGNWSAT